MSTTDAPVLSLRQLEEQDTSTLQALLAADAGYARRVAGAAVPARAAAELLLEWVARWPEVRRLRATIVATNAAVALAWSRSVSPGVSPERLADVGDVTVCHQTFGDAAAPTLLLIMGWGVQLVHWTEELCRRLAGHGFHVVRSDKRDAGRSTHLPGGTYTLEDMAGDAVALLDHLAAPPPHFFDISSRGGPGPRTKPSNAASGSSRRWGRPASPRTSTRCAG